MAKFKVLKITNCNCGNGKIRHPSWEPLFLEYYSPTEQDYRRHHAIPNHIKIPEMFITCPLCGGTKEKTDIIEVKDAIFFEKGFCNQLKNYLR